MGYSHWARYRGHLHAVCDSRCTSTRHPRTYLSALLCRFLGGAVPYLCDRLEPRRVQGLSRFRSAGICRGQLFFRSLRIHPGLCLCGPADTEATLLASSICPDLSRLSLLPGGG